MARRTSTIIWSVALGLLASIGLLAAVVGPRLVREIRAVAGPIVRLSRGGQAIQAMNREFPFVVPDDGIVSEERLVVYLDIWDELRPRYHRWMSLVDEKKPDTQGQSWDEAKGFLGATQEVQAAQVEILRSHGMSPAELAWIEEIVLSSWWKKVASMLANPNRNAVIEELRQASRHDLDFISELESRHGTSAVSVAMRKRLEKRLASFESTTGPEIPQMPATNQELFWRHRDRIAAIGDPDDHPLHGMLRGGGRSSSGARHRRRHRPIDPPSDEASPSSE